MIGRPMMGEGITFKDMGCLFDNGSEIHQRVVRSDDS